MTAPIGITLSLDGVQQTEAGLRRVAGGVDSVGVSAKQTAAALRGVPAQFTDIVTSLASGQAPLTVFLQQGGQLKDMFGGAGNAAKALGGYVVGLVNPFTVAAAAGVALALAYKQGSAEADAYARSIALTGNAAGVTTSQLQGMAERVSAVAGTQSKAAEVVAQLVGTGSVASQSLEQFTATAIRLERNAGVAVKDTVKEFAELGKEPVEAAKKLNERYNYLTAAVYEQIKALQEQGKASEAAALSQQTYDKAMSLVASTLEGRLGYIERAWRAVGDASKWAWDKMLNVGRPDTLKDQLDRARANLEQRLNTPLAVDNPAMRASREKGIEALRNEINLLQEQERMTRRGAEAQAERAKAEKAGIEAADALLKTQDKGLTKQQQMNAALKEYRAQLEALRAVNPNSERLAPAAVARGERAIRDQFKDQAGAATGESELATIKAKITETEKYIEALRTQGLEGAKLNDGERMALKIREDLKTSITGTARANKELALVEAEKLGLVQRAAAAEEQRQKAVKKSTDEYAKLVESTFKAADALQEQADKQQAANAVYGKGAAAIDELALATLKSRMAEAQASDSFSDKFIAALEAQIQAQERLNAARAEGRFKEMNESLDRELAAANQQAALYQDELRLTGLSALERAKIVAMRQSELELARDLEKIEQGGFEDAEKEQLRIKAREKQRVAGSAAVNKVIQDDFARTSETIERSLTDALLRGFESGKSFAKNLRDTIANMFKTLVLRPIISAVVNPVAGAITGALGLAGTASAATSVAGAYTGLQGTTGILGNIGTFLGTNTVATNTAIATSLGIDAASASAAATGASAAGGGALGGLLSNPITMGLGAIAALSLLSKLGKGETRTGGQFGVAFDGSVTNQRRGQTYTIEGQQFDRDFTNGLQTALKDGIAYRLEGDPVAQESAIREAVAGTASGINGFLKALGSAATLTGFSAGLETSSKDRGGVFAGGLLSTGAAFGESGKGDNYAGTLYEAFSTNSPDFKTALENFTLDLKQSTIQALQTVTDIPQSVQKLLKGVDAEGLADDAANKLLETINAQIVGVNSLRDAFKAMGLDGLAALGFDAAAGLAEVSGGFDKLLGKLNTYYSNFFSADEQRANVQRQLQQAFAGLNLTLPDINADDARAQFRAIVEGAQQDLSESGQKTYATLLSLSGAFAGVTKELDGAATAVGSVGDAARNLKSDIAGLQIDLLRAKGDATGANAAQRALDTTGLSAADVALYDYKQALIDQINTLNAASQAIADQTEIRKGFERQLLELQGDTAALRLLDIAGMDAANVALYDRVQALTASQAAEQVAADKAKQVAQERYGIETQRLQLEGNTAALRARELALLDPANRADQLRLYLLQDAQEAAKAAADAERDLAATRVQSAQDAYRAAQEATGSAFDALSRSVSAERSLYESTRAAAADAAQEIKSVIDTLSGSIQDLYAGVDSTRQASAAEGSAFIARALQAARTTGYLPDSKGLSDAITQARGGLGSQNYATQFEADRAQLVMAGQLSELSDIAKPQLTAAERTLRNAENQLKTLDDILKNAQSQVDAVRGISTTVGTIPAALYGLQAALLAEAQAKAQAQATTPLPETAPTTPTTPPVATTPTGGALSGPYASQITDAIKAAAYTADDRLVYDTARMFGVTSSELDKLMGWTAGTSLDWAKRNNLPAFAVGTNYVPRDMLATIHEGEAIVPKAFNPWAAGGQGMGGGNAEVVAELRALRQQNERLESRLASIEGSNNTMANLLDDVTDGGNAMRSEVMA